MPAYTNYYETIKEARMRLLGTVILYDNRPYYVLAIADHKADGIYRMYLDDLLHKDGPARRRIHGMPYDWCDEGVGHTVGDKMDEWMEKQKQTPEEIGVIRKMMNSPLFNKFRPFPLGMVNVGSTVMYVERQPTRNTLQGLAQQMLNVSSVSIVPKEGIRPRSAVSVDSVQLARTIINDYPSPEECLKALSDDRVANEGAAFHRQFAIMRGPLDMMFVAYKSEVIGILPNHDLSVITIGRNYSHCKEAVAELNVFGDIQLRKKIQ